MLLEILLYKYLVDIKIVERVLSMIILIDEMLNVILIGYFKGFEK